MNNTEQLKTKIAVLEERLEASKMALNLQARNYDIQHQYLVDKVDIVSKMMLIGFGVVIALNAVLGALAVIFPILRGK